MASENTMVQNTSTEASAGRYPGFQSTLADSAETGEQNDQLKRVLAMLRGRMHWVVILSLILGVTGGVGGYFSQTDEYRTVAELKISPRDEKLFGGGGRFNPMFAGMIETQVRVMQSDEVIQLAHQSDAWQDHFEKRSIESPSITNTVETLAEGLKDIRPPSRESYIVGMIYEAGDPHTAQAGAVAIATAYKQVHDAQYLTEERARLRELRRRESDLQAEKRQFEQEKSDLMLGTNEAALLARATSQTDKLGELENSMLLLDLEISKMQSNDPSDLIKPRNLEEFLVFSAEAQEIQLQIDAFKDQVQALSGMGLGESHFRVRNLRSEIHRLETKLGGLAEQAMAGGIQQDVSVAAALIGLKAQREQLAQALAQVKQSANDLNDTLTRVQSKNEEIGRLDEKVLALQDRIDLQEEELEVRAREITTQVSVLGEPKLPTSPSNRNKRTQLAILGGMGGMGMGIGLVLLLGAMDSRLRYASDAQYNFSDSRILGILPTLPKNLADQETLDIVHHAVHHIRTLLQIDAKSDEGMAYAVTSPSPGAGKSSLTVALGLSFANAGSRTLLIDCDIVGAGISRRLGKALHTPLVKLLRHNDRIPADDLEAAVSDAHQRRVSLEDVLVERNLMDRESIEEIKSTQSDQQVGLLDACVEGNLSGCVSTTEIDRLYVLPVGEARANDAGTLSPKTLQRLIDQAKHEFDVVLLDTGPIMGSLEASMASAQADRVLMIVSRGDSRSLAQKSLDHLANVGANVAGLVFNHAKQVEVRGSSYASMFSVDRRQPSQQSQPTPPDAQSQQRFGPLGSILASTRSVSAPASTSAQKHTRYGSSNGHSNGHAA